jgi:hypothetical protein
MRDELNTGESVSVRLVPHDVIIMPVGVDNVPDGFVG